MKIEAEECFPCGYKQKILISGWFNLKENANIWSNECPIHGKDCPKLKENVKIRKR